MAQHTGLFDWIKKKTGTDPILLRSFFSYFTHDGSPVGIDDLPDDNCLVTKGMLDAAVAGFGAPVRVPFTTETNLVIDWQTDTPPGNPSTYFAIFGNNLEAFVYFTGSPGGQPYTWTLDGDNNIDVVTFDWGSSQSGYIRF